MKKNVAGGGNEGIDRRLEGIHDRSGNWKKGVSDAGTASKHWKGDEQSILGEARPNEEGP